MIDLDLPDYANTPAAPLRPAFPYAPAAPGAQPVVSVITPFYNTDDVFLETARSLRRQSFQDYEWIIVDDGSTDETALTRLRDAQRDDARIKVITQENAGPSAARNTAFRHASGRYVCMLDSDDMVEPTFIEKCVWFLESNPSFGFCNTWSVNFGDQEFLWQVGFERGAAHLDANSGPPISVIRREAIAASGGFDESIRLGHEDWDFWLGLAKVGYWGHTIPEYQEWYRKRTSGRFHQVMTTASVNRDFEALIKRKYDGLKANFPAPSIKYPEPYESVPYEIPFANRLGKGDGVRRILFLLPWMVTGGADRVNLDWIAALTRNGYGVSICATLNANHNWLSEFAKLTPDIFILTNFLRCVDYPRFLRYLIESRGIDLVLISGSTFGYHVLPYLRANCPGVAFIDLCHVEEPHWMNGGHPRFGVGYQEMLDLSLVTNVHLRDWMKERGADSERIAVCHTGIDIARLDNTVAARDHAREALEIDRTVPVIVFSGRICEQKRPKFLAEILRALSERGVTYKALIVGDGELRLALEDQLRNANLMGCARMMGSVSHDAWLQALAASDIFLLPSQYEGISVALLEAMGMGVVPVTAAVGGQDEVVNATCGFLMPQGANELDAYVEALSRLIADVPLRQEMRRACRERILAQFSATVTTSHFLAALERARELAQNQPRPPITRGFAQELATLAVEYARLSSVASFLWTHWTSTSGKAAETPPPEISLGSLARLLAALNSTRFGAAMLRSKRLRLIGQWLTAKLEARYQVSDKRA